MGAGPKGCALPVPPAVSGLHTCLVLVAAGCDGVGTAEVFIPNSVEPLICGLVHTLIRVRAEEVSLSLNQVCRQAVSPAAHPPPLMLPADIPSAPAQLDTAWPASQCNCDTA